MDKMVKRINELKKERNAVIIAHLYQSPEVQDIADFVGDSFELSRKAMQTDAQVIVFCGVHFMAESAKILNPDRRVLLPVLTAGCPMADMVTAQDVRNLRAQYPDAAVVCYVNTSAAVKAECDVCCTSSNAVKIVKALPNKRIIFLPDENLGSFIAKSVPEKEIILHKGFCVVHTRVKPEEVDEAKKAKPGALVLVHPECPPNIIAKADFTGSTSQIINYVRNSDAKEFIIGTEQGILHRLKNENPDKRFYLLSHKLICTNMKKTNLPDVLHALETMTHEISLTPEIIVKASGSLYRMLEMANSGMENSK